MIDFSDAVASHMQSVFHSVSGYLMAQSWKRRELVADVMAEFRGPYAAQFSELTTMEARDRSRLAQVLEETAHVVARAQVAAEEERSRRQREALWPESASGFGYVMGPPVVTSEFRAGERPRSTPEVRNSSVVSADPVALRRFVDESRVLNSQLQEHLGQVSRAWQLFANECRWVRFDPGTLLGGFEYLLEENRRDERWVEVVAETFERVGGTRVLAAFVTSALTGTDATKSVPWTRSPSDAAVWWQSLTPEEQEFQITHVPEMIGCLDGVDMASRDRANRLVLKQEMGPAAEELAAVKQKLLELDELSARAEGKEIADDVAAAERRVAELDAVQKALTDGADRHLLLLDLSGEVAKAAVAMGDVDTARHVTAYVPGMTSKAQSIDKYAETMTYMREQAREVSSLTLEEIATVVWLGYEAPQRLDVASVGKAKAGAASLVEFAEGITASREVTGVAKPHLTLVGHSYGSTVAGMAATQVTTGVVDDLALLASPGSGAQDTDAYNISGKAYYSAVPHGDNLVQGRGPDDSFGKNPAEMPGFEELSDDATGATNDKGERVYDADATGPLSNVNHSVYLMKNTETSLDVARVMAGVK